MYNLNRQEVSTLSIKPIQTHCSHVPRLIETTVESSQNLIRLGRQTVYFLLYVSSKSKHKHKHIGNGVQCSCNSLYF